MGLVPTEVKITLHIGALCAFRSANLQVDQDRIVRFQFMTTGALPWPGTVEGQQRTTGRAVFEDPRH